MEPPGESSAAATSGDDTNVLEAAAEAEEASSQDRDTWRKAGQQYFNEKLLQAQFGQNEHIRPIPSDSHADIEVVDSLIQANKLQVQLVAGLCTRALSVFAIQACMRHLEAPALMVFFHQTSLLLCLWLLRLGHVLDFSGISKTDVLAALPLAALESVQLILFFRMLVPDSADAEPENLVFAVVAVTTCIATLLSYPDIDVLVATLDTSKWAQLSQAPLHWAQAQQVGAGMVVVGALVLVLSGPHSLDGAHVLAMLAWIAVAALKRVWTALQQRADLVAALAAYMQWKPVTQQAVEAIVSKSYQQEPTVTLLLTHSLSCLPVLVLGFVFQEGPELLAHELSIPSLIGILFSCVCFAALKPLELASKSSTFSEQQVMDAYFFVLLIPVGMLVEAASVLWLHIFGALVMAAGLYIFSRGRPQGVGSSMSV